jgi:hypothetical protein
MGEGGCFTLGNSSNMFHRKKAVILYSSTNSINTISAESPRRGPIFRIRV